MAKPREIVGAAARFVGRKLRGKEPDQSWQEQAWGMYDNTPELRFASNWIGNAMSKALLYAGRRMPDGTIEPAPDDHMAVDLVTGIAGGPSGQAEMLGEFGPHLVVAGEGHLVVCPTFNDGTRIGEDWKVLSVLELSRRGNRLEAEIDGEPMIIPPFDPENPDPDAPIDIRVWDPHPRRHIESDSPTRSSLGLLEELRLLNAAVAAIARSRLVGRGVLFVPQGTRFPTAPGQQGAEDDLLETFMTVAETAYREPESAAATVPIILEVPMEALGSWERMTFESDFDELAIQLRDQAIRRFATGVEIPAEYLLGLGTNTNHWSIWALQQEAIQLAIEPRLATVTDALTKQWLWPWLEEAGVEDARDFLVWYDTSPLRVRSNRAQTALELFDRSVITAVALRRETGFDDSDAPDAAEEPEEEPSTPELPVDEEPRPPGTEDDEADEDVEVVAGAGLAEAVDGLVYHALQKSGKRLWSRQPRPDKPHNLTEWEAVSYHTRVPMTREDIEAKRLLHGLWDRVPDVAARFDVDPECMTDTLNDYCIYLIAEGELHKEENIDFLLRTPCLAGAN